MLSIVKRVLSLPEFENKSDTRTFAWFVFASLCTVSGSWFSQIAVFSAVLSMTNRKTPVAILFVCSFVPKLCSPYLWRLIQRHFSGKSIITVSELAGALASAIQVYAIVTHDVFPIYAARFVQGISGSFIHLAYDSVTVGYFKKPADINKSNSILSIIDYTGLTVAPFLGGLCASYIGNISAIVADGISYLVAAVTFMGIRSAFLDTPNDKADTARIGGLIAEKQGNSLRVLLNSPVIMKFNITTLLLNNISYSFLNFLIPIMILSKLSSNEKSYGVAMAAWGVGYIITGKLLNTSFFSQITTSTRYISVIISTAMNGVFLLAAMYSRTMVLFSLFVFFACVASLISIVYLKTSIYSDPYSTHIRQLPGLYNGLAWSGSAIGFVVCALLGDSFPLSIFILAMGILLFIGPSLFSMAMLGGCRTLEVSRDNVISK